MATRKSELAVPGNPNFEQWVGVMKTQADDLDSDVKFDVRDLFARATQAETFEESVEILNGGAGKNAKGLVGVVHAIQSYELRRSDEKYTKGSGLQLGVYAVVHAVTKEGEELVYTTGAPNILAILWQAEKFSRLPLMAVITSKETSEGEMLSLKPVV